MIFLLKKTLKIAVFLSLRLLELSVLPSHKGYSSCVGVF